MFASSLPFRHRTALKGTMIVKKVIARHGIIVVARAAPPLLTIHIICFKAACLLALAQIQQLQGLIAKEEELQILVASNIPGILSGLKAQSITTKIKNHPSSL